MEALDSLQSLIMLFIMINIIFRGNEDHPYSRFLMLLIVLTQTLHCCFQSVELSYLSPPGGNCGYYVLYTLSQFFITS